MRIFPRLRFGLREMGNFKTYASGYYGDSIRKNGEPDHVSSTIRGFGFILPQRTHK